MSRPRRSSLTVPISTFTATDNVAVTGYLVTETSTKPTAGAVGWSVVQPTIYTFASAGSKTLYGWARDAAGNVSNSRSATVTITLAPAGTSGTHAAPWRDERYHAAHRDSEHIGPEFSSISEASK